MTKTRRGKYSVAVISKRPVLVSERKNEEIWTLTLDQLQKS